MLLKLTTGRYSIKQSSTIYQTVLTSKLKTYLSNRNLTYRISGPINTWYPTIFWVDFGKKLDHLTSTVQSNLCTGTFFGTSKQCLLLRGYF